MRLSPVRFCKASARSSTVWLSASTSIFRNLAFEDWLFRNFDCATNDCLLIWRNKPAVVVGRHQNCFVECDVDYATANNIEVVRRNSGGGAVYHNLDNVNLSFITSKERHNRVQNLNLTKNVLKKYWNVDVSVTKRHDLVINDDLKISGTAAKIARKNAYHHFTLLLDLDVNRMKQVLRSSFETVFQDSPNFAVESKATSSVRAKVGCLRQLHKFIDYDSVVNNIVTEYSSNYENVDVVEITDPSNDNFPGLDSTEHELRSWDWIFGRNPPFSLIERSNDHSVLAKLSVEKGLVSNMTSQAPHRSITEGERFDMNICKTFTVPKGSVFWCSKLSSN